MIARSISTPRPLAGEVGTRRVPGEGAAGETPSRRVDAATSPALRERWTAAMSDCSFCPTENALAQRNLRQCRQRAMMCEWWRRAIRRQRVRQGANGSAEQSVDLALPEIRPI